MGTKSSFFRFTAKLFVFLMMLQGLLLIELGYSYQWSPDNYVNLFQRVIGFMEPAIADAAELETPVEQGIFGPKKYLRTTGKPDVYQDVFHAVPGSGTMVIRNCEADSKHRVTSALIFVNGVQLYGPRDFKQDVYILDVPLDLQEVNDIHVELRSKPGTYLTIEFTQQPPVVDLSAAPDTIILGESAELSWSSKMAASCEISPAVGMVNLNGNITVTPTVTTTYTIIASAPAGSAIDHVTVTVIPPPTVTFSATPMTVIEGGPVTLSWASKHADIITIEPMIGTVQANGSTKVNPSQTTTYTITASGPGGTTSDSTTVNIIPKEKASIRVNYTYDKKGQLEEAATLISIDD